MYSSSELTFIMRKVKKGKSIIFKIAILLYEGFDKPEAVDISPNPGRSDPLFIIQAKKI